jgi:hypothetical protein
MDEVPGAPNGFLNMKKSEIPIIKSTSKNNIIQIILYTI